MKKILLFVLTFTLAFIFVFSQSNVAEAAIKNKPGDIIVTKSTSSKGVTGHVGIYIGEKTILHTSGWKSEPYPTTISESNWHKRYAKSKVIRPNSSKLGADAAAMAKKHFKDKKISYSISAKMKKKDKTYCSHLVWYSYYKAGKSFKTSYDSPQTGLTWRVPSTITPYNFINGTNVSYNGFKFIDNKW